MQFKPGQRVRIIKPGSSPRVIAITGFPVPAGKEATVIEGNHRIPLVNEAVCRVAIDDLAPPPGALGWLVRASSLRPLLPPDKLNEVESLFRRLGVKNPARVEGPVREKVEVLRG